VVVGVEASVTKYVAEVQKVVQSSGLKSHMHSYGTTIEGPWDKGISNFLLGLTIGSDGYNWKES
jgi:uncharacterized protein YqgV (UPF0045/DUF77 family)